MRNIDADLEAWLLCTAPRAIAYARSLIHHPDDAEDLVHDVLLRLLNHNEYDLLKDGEKLLFRSVTNACINRQARAHEMASLDAWLSEDGGTLHEIVGSGRSDPVELAISRELAVAIERELRGLPPLQRAAVELRSMDKPLKEIAEILGLTATNAGVLVCRGRKLLAERLAPHIREFNR